MAATRSPPWYNLAKQPCREVPMSQPAPSAPTLPFEVLRQIDLLADRFEAGLRDGAPPAIESLLAEVPPEARPQLLGHLLHLEADYRRQQGHPLTTAEAHRRFAGLGAWAIAVLGELGFEETTAFLTLETIAGPQAGRVFHLGGHATCLVGRGPAGVHLAIEGDRGMSRVHFLVEYNPPCARVDDLRSKNSTFLNGRAIDQDNLRDGDEIRAGQTIFKVKFLLAKAPLPSSRATDRLPDGASGRARHSGL